MRTEVEDGVEVEYLTEAEIKARLAGIAAARAQLVAQRDTVSDERRNGLAMAAIGAVATLLTIPAAFRHPRMTPPSPAPPPCGASSSFSVPSAISTR